MEGNILRTELRSRDCTFLMLGDANWKIVGTRQNTVHRIQMYVYWNNQLKYSLEQDNLFKQFINYLPLSQGFYLNPFIFHQDRRKYKASKIRILPLFQGTWEFTIEGNTFLVTVHSKGVYSLLMNGEQVAVYKRARGGSSYRVRYIKKMDQQHDILILFPAFLELYTCLEKPKGLDSDAFVIPWDRFIERARWLPEDDADKEPFCTWTSWQEKWRAHKAAKQRGNTEDS